MKLWLISQRQNNCYDTYDAAVVAAETEAEAKRMHPAGYPLDHDGRWASGTWCESADDVTAECIGEADGAIERGVVLSSFNAG